jgi:hypothetical protein
MVGQRRWVRVVLLLALIGMGTLGNIWGSMPTTRAATGDVGTRDFAYNGPSVSEPTSQKPQSKLWYTPDNIWWGVLFDVASDDFEIYRFDVATDRWVATNIKVDERNQSLADALWDGTHLYVASAVTTTVGGTDLAARVLRYSYDAATGKPASRT